MLKGEDESVYGCSTRYPPGDEHGTVATPPVQTISRDDDEAKKHRYEASKEGSLHRRYMAYLLDADIHHGKEECSGQHVQNTLIDLHNIDSSAEKRLQVNAFSFV
jgi:hypothetical protein